MFTARWLSKFFISQVGCSDRQMKKVQICIKLSWFQLKEVLQLTMRPWAKRKDNETAFCYLIAGQQIHLRMHVSPHHENKICVNWYCCKQMSFQYWPSRLPWERSLLWYQKLTSHCRRLTQGRREKKEVVNMQITFKRGDMHILRRANHFIFCNKNITLLQLSNSVCLY